MKIFILYQNLLKKLPVFDGVPALLIRLYLAPVFIIAGYSKTQLANPEVTGLASLSADPNIIAWFGNADWGLGLPFPALLANLATWTEFFGGWLLLFGVLTRLVSIPLMFTMVVAATSVHLDNGWFAITPTNPDTSPAKVLSWVGIEGAQQSLDNSLEAKRRLDRMRDIIDENGNPEWLYEKGNIVVLNNGIEFATTYFIMLLALFFIGAGRFTSVDYYLSRKLEAKHRHHQQFG
ncbi:DoxX family protein [Thalassomonas viridans]|uniref:DoxX family protein n=1 Tax=Thalassomonas viridans TaxID=137584 RepID=A0AAE9Z9U0_9GAMM|nr:DoxX family protein [Thalassomonas viridans]WDE07958.1 DoxX family protein [Thalassomonas viridans]